MLPPEPKRRLWFLAGVGWCLLFFVACLIPHPPSVPAFPMFDKIEHAGAFVLIAGWFAVLYPRFPWRVLAVLCLYAACTELAQWASGYRQGDPLDWLADTLGSVVGLMVARKASTSSRRWVVLARERCHLPWL